MKTSYYVVAIFAFLVLAVVLFGNSLYVSLFAPNELQNSTVVTEQELRVEQVNTNLQVPWEIVFLTDTTYIVTERPGTLTLFTGDNQVAIPVPDVNARGEGGLLGAAKHPAFEENNYLYLYITTETGQGTVNRVDRFTLTNNSLVNRTTIIDDIPGARYHDGGRIDFGPNNYLFITTGDAGQEQLAQDTSSLAGKILRVYPDGSVPEDNPFRNEVWSYGHRNPQGITWDDEGRLWSTEHGRSGIRSGYDELNLIEKGANYGWPVIQGPEERSGIETPVIQSGPETTWAPADAAYRNGSIWFPGLRGQALYEYGLESGEFTAHLREEYGRLRSVVRRGEELFFTTSNTDGRGTPRLGDDKLLVVT